MKQIVSRENMKNLRIICVVLISIMPPPYEASNHGDNSPTREVQKIKQYFTKFFVWQET